MDNAALHVNAEAPPLSGVALETLAKEHIAVENIIARLPPLRRSRAARDQRAAGGHARHAKTSMRWQHGPSSFSARCRRAPAIAPRTATAAATRRAGSRRRRRRGRAHRHHQGAARHRHHALPAARVFRHQRVPSHHGAGGQAHDLLSEGAFVKRGERQRRSSRLPRPSSG